MPLFRIDTLPPRSVRMCVLPKRMGEIEEIHKKFSGIIQRERPLERPSRGWEYNIKINLSETGDGC